jgi:hypothetical protein
MLLGTKGFGSVAGAAKHATGTVASAAMTAGTGIARGVQDAASTAASAGRDAAARVEDRAASLVPDISTPNLEKPAEVVSAAGAAIRDGVQSAVSSGREYGQVLHSRLSERLEQQPLLLGAIGLAIGAGIASTFPTTEVESQWLGEHGETARNALDGAVEDAKTRARNVLSEVEDEAVRQGFTMGAAREAASSVADKVKTVAGVAQEAVKKPFASAS